MKIRTSLLVAALAMGASSAAYVAYANDRDKRGPALEEIDNNADGDITRAEVDAHQAAIFAEIDANGDGTVSEDEFVAHAEARRAEHAALRYARMFDMADSNDDGVVSPDETGGRLDRMFDRMDTDNDGVVTEAEREAAHGEMRRRHGQRGGHGPRERGE